MNLNDISTQLLFTTLPIWVESTNGVQGFGTGFLYMHPIENDPQKSIPFLVSNYHVFRDDTTGFLAKRCLTQFTERDGDNPSPTKHARVEFSAEDFMRHGDHDLDITAIPIGPTLNQLQATGHNVFFRSIAHDLMPQADAIEKLAAIEEVTFIGYPSGLYDEKTLMPIVRRGITATPVWNDFNGEPVFLIDAGVFPGSSGSPVFLFNQGSYTSGDAVVIGSRLIFLGILSSSFAHLDGDRPQYYLGLGKVLKSQRVQLYLETLAKKLIK